MGGQTGGSQNPFQQLANTPAQGSMANFLLPMQALGAVISGQNPQQWAQNYAQQRGMLQPQSAPTPLTPAPYQNTAPQQYQNRQFIAPGSPAGGLLSFLSQLRNGQ